MSRVPDWSGDGGDPASSIGQAGPAADGRSANSLVVRDLPTELDAGAVGHLDETLRTAVLDWGRPVPPGGTVIVDLAEVAFIDSAGVACLLTWQRQATEVGIDLRVRNLRPIVAKVFSVLGVMDALLFQPTSVGREISVSSGSG